MIGFDHDEDDDRPMSDGEAAAAVVTAALKHSKAAKARRVAERRALPLLAALGANPTGTHAYAGKDFDALVRYLTDGSPARTWAARTSGRLRVGSFTLVRDKTLVASPAQPPAKPAHPRVPWVDAEKEWRQHHDCAEAACALLKGLPAAGTVEFPPAEFRRVVEYLLDGEPDADLATALKRDRVKIGGLTIACKREPSKRVTLSAFARAKGIPQQTLHKRANKAGLKNFPVGNRLLYDFAELNSLLLPVRG